TLQTPDYRSGIAYLTYHMGKNLNVEDSAAVNNKGIAIFSGKRHLPGGIYSIVFPGKSKSVDFFIDRDQLITIKADTTDLINKTNIITHEDSLQNYYYYKAHYWDGITFMDERVIRTPFFLPKLEKYYREIVPPEPDSIIKESDYQLLLARTSPEMYKFLLNW